MLVDPTVDDPWAHLDFDPQTGKLTARFILAQNMASERGIETVAALHFDFREELHSQYRKSWKRLTKVAMEFLKSNSLDAKSLVRELNEADDHGLLGWCVHGAGLNEAPFDSLWKAAPDAFEKLSAAH